LRFDLGWRDQDATHRAARSIPLPRCKPLTFAGAA
jgi:hypothetical protein